ncbi:MAG: hypothetical protein K8Q91_02170 [Candidatus Vogelbacteria bacterium]|nr:hypothetical protein [Candidatus Vogelbacteria bacterium]
MLVVIIVLLLLLLAIAAPVQIMANKKKLKQMDTLIEAFEAQSFETPEAKENAKRVLKKKLVGLKAKILADKKSTEIADDKLNIL